MKSEFENELSKQGFVFKETSNGYYNITPRNRIVLPTTVQLVISKPINPIYHGSQNANELDGIGLFFFSLNSEQSPKYFIFSFKHLRDDSTEYMIISTDELRERMNKNMIRYRTGEFLELRLWLIESNLYDTTTIFLPAERFYFMKNREGGRKIDGTMWNYTRFLNNWVLGSRD